jgi:hypothetical protein
VATVKAEKSDDGSGRTYTHTFDGTYDRATGAFTATGTKAVEVRDDNGIVFSYANPEHVTGTFDHGVLTFTSDYDATDYVWGGTAHTKNKGGAFEQDSTWNTINSGRFPEYHNAPLTGSVDISDAQGNSKG